MKPHSVQEPDRKITYAITDLGTLGGLSESAATDINNKGQIVGWCGVEGRITRGFLWQNGRMTDLGTPQGSSSKALALNDNGQIVGWSGDKETENAFAYLWKNGKARALGTLPTHKFSIATGINNRGDICGFGFGYQSGPRVSGCAFLLSNGKMIGLPFMDDETYASDINEKGQVVGYSVFLDLVSAILYQEGKTQELDGLWGSEVLAAAVNNQGMVVGYSSIRPGGLMHAHACLWRRGADQRAVDLGSLGGRSCATDINVRNQVVGWSSTARDQWQRLAVLWRSGKIQSLQDLIPQDSGWTLTTADALNNEGQIVGTGVIGGKTRAFLLTPL
ncbi:MAG: DUF3466 family protein [Armatimonadota bacterium]